MAIGDVTVSRLWGITISAEDSVREVLDSGDRANGPALAEALELATHKRRVFVVGPEFDVESEFVSERAIEGLPDVASHSVHAVISWFEKFGYASVRTVWYEEAGVAYLDQGRALESFEVPRAFRVVALAYDESRASRGLDPWRIVHSSPVVTAGLYVVGFVGDYGMTAMVGAAELEPSRDEESVFYWVAETEGFVASRCEARCDSCEAEWFAESASWHFESQNGTNAAAWDFDDVTDVDENDELLDDDVIRCPNCATGRVGFLVY